MILFADGAIDSEYVLTTNEYFNDICKGYWNPSHFCFGHDLHIGRIIILDLLNKNIIDNKITLIVKKDRQFLYNKIFDSVITFDEFISSNMHLDILTYKDIIFMPKIQEDLLYNRHNTDLLYLNYDVYNNSYWNENMITQITNIKSYIIEDNLSQLINDNNFIIFIIRSHKDFDLNKYLVYFNKIKIKCENKYKIILYIQNINYKKYFNSEYIIDNLELYITLLNHKNCKYLIGETSGGFEIGYYYHNCNLTLLEFKEHYSRYNEESIKQIIMKQSKYLERTDDVNNNIDNNAIIHFNITDALYYKNDDEINNFKNNIMARWNSKYIYPLNYYYSIDFDKLINII
uniref:Uncharacterized protein n=1 Tax=viral metagenome TaxID=1070528 RepID=A0A6C0LFI7_9ZZZZ